MVKNYRGITDLSVLMLVITRKIHIVLYDAIIDLFFNFLFLHFTIIRFRNFIWYNIILNIY